MVAALAAVLATGVASGTARANMDTAMGAYSRGDYTTAVNELKNLAVQGDSRAQYWLGYMYGYGNGVQQDQVEANRWYKNAAEHGYALAQVVYGYNADAGIGMTVDLAEAVRWYRAAAEQGHPIGQANLEHFPFILVRIPSFGSSLHTRRA